MKGYLKQISELNRSTLTVVALQFFVNASTFTSFPLLSVWLSKLGHSASLIATLLTIVLVVTKGLPLIGGQIVDRFGAKVFLVMGLLFRSIGFLSISFAQEPSALIISSILIGLGGAAYETASYGLLAKSPDSQRKFVFLINNQALNLGVILGPGLGAILVNFDIKLTFLSSSLLFFGGAVVAFFAVTEDRTAAAVPHNMLQLLKRVYSNRRFLALCAVLVPWWIIFAQLYTSFPIYYFSLSHELKNSQDIFLTNGVAGLLFSVVLVQLVKSKEESSLIQLAYFILAAIFLITPFALVKLAFIGIVVIYTAAETIILPSSDSEVGKIAEKGMEATYFGAAHISWIVGGTIGNYLGTYASDNNAYTYLWITLSGLALSGLLATRYYQTTESVALQHKHN